MSSPIKVPKLSATMEEATVLQWLKQPGDKIAGGEAVIELETDKTSIEVEVTENGYLSDHLVAESDVVAVGAVLAYVLESADEPLPEGGADHQTGAGGESEKKESKPEKRQEPSSPLTGDKSGRLRASPKAKRFAEKHGIDLATVEGSGMHGEISYDDVQAVMEKRGSSAAMTEEESPQRFPASAMRQRIAEQVSRSASTIPQYFVEVTVNTGSLSAVRKRLNETLPANDPGRVSYTDFLLQAVSDAGAECPEFGMVWQEGKPPELMEVGTANVGLIVALDEGLIIPVIRDVIGLSLTELAQKRVEAVRAARSNRLGSKYATPCAVSLSNLGAIGVDRFQAIIEPGQTAVLAVGAERQTTFIENEKIIIGRGMTLVLSVDHRVVDGVVAGRFMASLRARLESDNWR